VTLLAERLNWWQWLGLAVSMLRNVSMTLLHPVS
jgi:hypothetical protein